MTLFLILAVGFFLGMRHATDSDHRNARSALNEIATVAGLHIQMEEVLIPVSEIVQGACELLGLDPFYVANEGRFVAFVPEADADHTLEILRSYSFASMPCAPEPYAAVARES